MLKLKFIIACASATSTMQVLSDEQVQPLLESPDIVPTPSIIPSNQESRSDYSQEKQSSKPPEPEPSIGLKGSLKIITWNIIPLIITYLSTYLVRLVLFYYIKDKNNTYLTSAFGAGNTLIGLIGVAVIVSLNAGLTSRSAQAYGAKNYQLVGFYLHRALIINITVLVPCCCILYWSDAIFIRIGFEAPIALIIQQFTSYCIPGIFTLMLFNTMSSYLYSCNIFLPSAIVTVSSSVLFAIVAYFLMTKTNMDTGAIAISYNSMYTLNAIVIFLYIKIRDPVPGSFFWFKSQSFKEIWTLFKYEIFVGSMIYLEWIAQEITYLFSGSLSLAEITGMTITSANCQTLYALPVALSKSVLVFVGNSMGEGDVKKAQNFMKAGLLLNLMACICVESFYIVLSKEVAEFYTSDVSAIKVTVNIFLTYLLIFPADFIQIILSSGLRAIGKEKLGFNMFLVCYYLISIPLSYTLCFYAKLQVMGLVYGGMIATYCLLFWLMFSYSRIDWEKQKVIVRERIKNDQRAIEEPCNKEDNTYKDGDGLEDEEKILV